MPYPPVTNHLPTAPEEHPLRGRRRFVGALALGAAWLGTGAGLGLRPGGAGAASAPGGAGGPWQEAAAGAFETLDADWLDERRDRLVPIRLYLPRSDRPVPLVVFSHGLGGTRAGYAHLGRHWAAQGVATLHPQHAGSDRAVWSAGGLGVLGALRSAATPEQAFARAQDVRFVIDQAFTPGALAERLDASRIAVAGHSFGANTALLACGARYRNPDGRVSECRDERVRAAVVLSAPSLPTDQDPGFAYRGVAVPSLHLTGTHDSTPIPGLSTEPAQRRVAFDRVPGGPRFLGVFEGGRHSMFNDWSRDEAIKAGARSLTAAFWRLVFDGDPHAGRLLREPTREWPRLGPVLAAWEAQA
jgi:predicted dienelactone hydrolase